MLLSIDVGIKNLAMCLINPDTRKISQWEVDGIPPLHADGIFPCMKKHLDDRPWVLDATTVLIEKQPDKNKGIKSVEHFLHTYFLMKDKTVIIYDARFKIPDVAGPGKAKYIERKRVSVERCREFVKESNADKLDYFEKHKKKDDLADTVMQALSFIDRIVVEPKKAKKLTPRKPTENQKESRYSKANLAWLVKTGAKQDARFKKDLGRYYSSVDELKKEFQL
jgi:Poxvirus A22 protein